MPAYWSPANRGLPPFQMDWWVCMPEPLSPKSGFGMKVTVLLFRLATFLMMYLNIHDLVGALDQVAEPDVDLGLARGRHFMVLTLDVDADLLHLRHHLGADVLLACRWAEPGSSLPCGAACSRGSGFPRGRCSRCLRAVDVVVAFMGVLVKADVVEDEEFRLRTRCSRCRRCRWT